MDGILLFDKPILWTSHDAVDFIRRRLGQKKVGHAGTLDPLAVGLLVILLGSFTKVSERLRNLDKDYRGTMTLGMATDTQDMEGRIVSTAPSQSVRKEDLEKVFSGFVGLIDQMPPVFSAVRKGGQKLYEWARRGRTVEIETRSVRVSEFRLDRYEPPEACFFVSCSKGTYVRALCDEAGKRLGTGATLSSLVRTRIGPWKLEQALTADQMVRMPSSEIEKKLVKNLERIPTDESLSRFSG